ncbi:MAG: electron transfer flavoprotein beta subunit [Thermoplasmata archaeon]|jgi:electron transfer flavoprotein alpha/beta subunit|nr:electron transfer flavoprotein beta subunit [Thermoplasmata archaeon]
MSRLRILIPVTGAFFGRIRLRRSSGTLDTEGLDRVLSEPSARAITLALQLRPDAELVAVHVDKGAGEEVLREALAHGVDQGILIEGAHDVEADALARAATIARVYRENGPFDAILGPARSEFSGFTGALAALAGQLELPCVVGVRSIKPEGAGFRIQYHSPFGDYDLRIPRPCVVTAGDIQAGQPPAGGIHDAWATRGLLRVPADELDRGKPATKRVRIEQQPTESRTLEQVDGATLVRRMRSRSLIGERGAAPSPVLEKEVQA